MTKQTNSTDRDMTDLSGVKVTKKGERKKDRKDQGRLEDDSNL